VNIDYKSYKMAGVAADIALVLIITFGVINGLWPESVSLWAIVPAIASVLPLIFGRAIVDWHIGKKQTYGLGTTGYALLISVLSTAVSALIYMVCFLGTRAIVYAFTGELQ
jgi:hypothetical protein